MDFKKIDGFESYEISKNGEVRNIKTKRIIKPYLYHGYHRVSLIKEKGVKKSESIHRLVATTFIPNIDNKPIVDHINQNKIDNNVSNLRWSTYKENANNIDNDKRVHKNIKIDTKIGLIYCNNRKRWIVRTKNKIVCFDNINDGFEYLKLKL